jgi:hypothetical protein
MAVIAREPAIDAPMAVSMATFSFTAHSQRTVSLNFATFSRISVEGVPGYALATTQPACATPCATASFAESIFFIETFPLPSSDLKFAALLYHISTGIHFLQVCFSYIFVYFNLVA